jgi:hypothetical protein
MTIAGIVDRGFATLDIPRLLGPKVKNGAIP